MSSRSLRAELPTELLANLTLRELRGKFKRSTLGWLWSIINPAVNLAVYTVVFGVFLDVAPPVGDPSGLEVYGFFLVCGLLPWTFLTNALNGSVASLVLNAGLIKKVYFPRAVLPTAVTLSMLASFGVELLVLAVALLFAGNMVLPWIPAVLVLMALQLVFVLGLGLALSVLNAYFRDVEHFLGIALNVWFYATPILYPLTLVPNDTELFGRTIDLRAIVAMNPMHQFVDAYRTVLYDLRLPDAEHIAYLVIASSLALALGYAVFRRYEPNLAEEL